MKFFIPSYLVLLLLLCNISIAVAQSPEAFNYQTVVRDLNGDVLANQSIGFEIELLEDSATGTVTYQETHTITTNSQGVASMIIGQGTTLGGFTLIDWGNHTYFLQVGVDISGGTTYTVVGTSELLSVPYALHSSTTDGISFTPNGVATITSGTTALNLETTTGSTSSLRLQNLATQWNILNSTNGFIIENEDTENGVIKIEHNAASNSIYIDDNESIGIGTNTPDAGAKLDVNGRIKMVDGNQQTGYVLASDANGIASWTDPNTLVTGSGSGIFGTVSNVTSNASGDYTSDDFVFGSSVLGDNGTNYDSRFFFDKSKAAFRAGSSNNTQWDDINVGIQSSGFGSNNIASGSLAMTWGQSNEASGQGATVWGSSSIAQGIYATAWGDGRTATGRAATTWGYDYANSGSGATGDYSTAWGFVSRATNEGATAWGYETEANGWYATAWGTNNIASSMYETTFGAFSTTATGNANTWITTDRLFAIGNGTSTANRSNALTVYKDGTLTINDAYNLPNTDGTSGQVLSTDGSGEISWTTVTTTDNLGNHIATENIQLTNNWISNDGENEGIYVATDGNVGIGLTNPGQQFHVYGDGQGRFENSTNGRYLDLNTGSATLDMYNGSFNINRFSTTDIILGLGGGNVGIGNNTAPTYQLDVTGTGRFTNALTLGEYTLPIADGTTNQVLTTDGSGAVSWENVADSQDLTLTNNFLYISNSAGSVNMNPFMDNTDEQTLSISGSDLTISGGNTISLDSAFISEVGDGLTLTNNKVSLGGAINANLSLDIWDTTDFDISLLGTGDFIIRDQFNDVFRVDASDDRIDIGRDLYIKDHDADGTDVVRISGNNNNDGYIGIYRDGVVSHQLSGNGDVHFNKQGTNFDFQVESSNNATMFFVDSSNDAIGIGTSSPTKATVEINGGISNQVAASLGYDRQYGYLNAVGSAAGSNNILSLYDFNFSLWASDHIAAEQFDTFSDERIKTILGISSPEEDLNTLLDIKVTDYQLKDSIAKGNRIYKKVIAQQVAEVYPQAVTNNITEIVPDIYKQANIKNGWVDLSTDLKVNEHVAIIITKENTKEVYEVLEVSEKGFRIDFKNNQKVFVFGREVQDFHTVDYEAISMLNVSATQQLAKEVQQLKTENALLKAKLETITSDQAELATLRSEMAQIKTALGISTEIVSKE
ncbi:tail fiber domain-containing protein [Aquimarina sp. 2201CG5-10]|uniref:tail fiber domain-containing protein n=1 Tax=Aquimarina callyspongiae TaxID=3098150 RepID=UPI002AB41CEA|nr:tail fiber domain-containing protein [Aquimarina sp. 2201CG5-10]MDY8137942.1 tail fiber domain-containing protein [Aquimarina sp. 2201CG5-10]